MFSIITVNQTKEILYEVFHGDPYWAHYFLSCMLMILRVLQMKSKIDAVNEKLKLAIGLKQTNCQ